MLEPQWEEKSLSFRAELDAVSVTACEPPLLQVWTNQADRWALIRSDLRTRILQTLTQAGIEIPYRQVDLNLRAVTDAAAAALQPARRTPAPGDGGAATSP